MERETPLMKRVRAAYGGRELGDILETEYNALGLPGMSLKMGVGRGTLWYWMLRCGIKTERVASHR